jgi:hypothetical protein
LLLTAANAPEVAAPGTTIDTPISSPLSLTSGPPDICDCSGA